jgi:hypothetical protein
VRGTAIAALGVALALVASLGGDAHGRGAGVVWNGDYQTGNFRQWKSLQAMPGGATIVTAPTRGGRYAARFVVRPGDDPIHSKGERAEARAGQRETGGFEGRERWYGWSTLFPATANLPPSSSSWNIFTQFHETSNDRCAPNISLQADTSHVPPAIKVRVLGGALTGCSPSSAVLVRPAPLQLGRWYDFVLHVKWSSDPARGFWELWVDGVRVTARIHMATLYRGQGAYLKQGFYRAASPLTTTVYDAGMRAGRSYEAVAP